MLKALVIKELRESAGIIALAVLAAVFTVAGLANLPLLPMGLVAPDGFPFVSGSFVLFLGWIIGLLALALGLKQTAWESGHNTYHFLLHRPVDRRFLFGTKLAFGLTAVLGLGALMILVYAAWARGPGRSGVPFFWSMTLHSWQLLLSLSLVYLGAFLSGIRPARWFGSRLAPVVAAGTMVFFLASFWDWVWITPFAVVVVAVILLAAIFLYVDARDY